MADCYCLEGMVTYGTWPMKEPVPTVCFYVGLEGIWRVFERPGLSIPGLNEVLAPRPDSASPFAESNLYYGYGLALMDSSGR